MVDMKVKIEEISICTKSLGEDSLIVYMIDNLHIELLASLFQFRSA